MGSEAFRPHKQLFPRPWASSSWALPTSVRGRKLVLSSQGGFLREKAGFKRAALPRANGHCRRAVGFCSLARAEGAAPGRPGAGLEPKRRGASNRC